MKKLLLNAALATILSNSSFAYDQKTTSKCAVTHDKYMAVKLGMWDRSSHKVAEATLARRVALAMGLCVCDPLHRHRHPD